MSVFVIVSVNFSVSTNLVKFTREQKKHIHEQMQDMPGMPGTFICDLFAMQSVCYS